MNPDTRLATSLLLSLLLSATNLRMAAEGRADIVIVGVRYVIGFVICFMLVGIVGRLFNSYLHQMPRAELAMVGVDPPDDEFERQTAASSDT